MQHRAKPVECLVSSMCNNQYARGCARIARTAVSEFKSLSTVCVTYTAAGFSFTACAADCGRFRNAPVAHVRCSLSLAVLVKALAQQLRVVSTSCLCSQALVLASRDGCVVTASAYESGTHERLSGTRAQSKHRHCAYDIIVRARLRTRTTPLQTYVLGSCDLICRTPHNRFSTREGRAPAAIHHH